MQKYTIFIILGLFFRQLFDLFLSFVQNSPVFVRNIFHKRLVELLQAIDIILCPLQHVARPLAGFARHDDLQFALHDAHLYIFAGHHGIAVEVHHSRLGTVDAQRLALECLDAAVLVDGLVEQLERQGRNVEHRERFQNGDVQQAVIQRRPWSDVGIVAVLRRVAAGDEESPVTGRRIAIHLQLVDFGPVLQALQQSLFQICQRSALPCLREFKADKGIEAHAARAEKGIPLIFP